MESIGEKRRNFQIFFSFLHKTAEKTSKSFKNHILSPPRTGRLAPAGAALDPDCPRGVPYEGGSQMLMPDVEDREALSALVRVTCDALPEKRRRR